MRTVCQEDPGAGRVRTCQRDRPTVFPEGLVWPPPPDIGCRSVRSRQAAALSAHLAPTFGPLPAPTGRGPISGPGSYAHGQPARVWGGRQAHACFADCSALFDGLQSATEIRSTLLRNGTTGAGSPDPATQRNEPHRAASRSPHRNRGDGSPAVKREKSALPIAFDRTSAITCKGAAGEFPAQQGRKLP